MYQKKQNKMEKILNELKNFKKENFYYAMECITILLINNIYGGLFNYGYDIIPVDITKKILFNKQGEFDSTYLRNRGINNKGLLYCLDILIQEDKMKISYEIVKIDFSNPNSQKEKIMDLVRKGNMAIIHVGPSEISPLTFSKNGHYLVISDIDKNNNFYVINSNKIGDKQLGIPFDYDTIIKNMIGRKESFNILFIKRIIDESLSKL